MISCIAVGIQLCSPVWHMTIWTIQPVATWNSLQLRKCLIARRPAREWIESYGWMAHQMRRRLPGTAGKWPWWGWCRWEGAARPRPDLRNGGHLLRGTRGVRIKLDIAKPHVLLSDFDAWHAVLNRWFLSVSEEEDEAFEQELAASGTRTTRPYPEPYHTRIVESWDRIFDLTAGDPDWRGEPTGRSVQATFWKLRLEEVKKVDLFTAR